MPTTPQASEAIGPNSAVVSPAPVSFSEAFWFWLKLGFISFGGPAGQIAIMHQELVEKRRWISEGRILHALNYCMVLPGPEAQQLATYIGWLMHRTLGGVVAGGLLDVKVFSRLGPCGTRLPRASRDPCPLRLRHYQIRSEL